MGFFGDSKAKKARKIWEALLLEAQTAQRSGDIKGYSQLMAKASELEKTVLELER